MYAMLYNILIDVAHCKNFFLKYVLLANMYVRFLFSCDIVLNVHMFFRERERERAAESRVHERRSVPFRAAPQYMLDAVGSFSASAGGPTFVVWCLYTSVLFI